ncbi:MAG: IS481 family transposase [Actinomycetota bacterium]|nr:IS481 family transposase [Actinomycetota bacterium]
MALVDLSVVEQRYRAVLAVERGEQKIVVAAQFGVSRQTLHTWLTRYARDGLAGLMDRTHRPELCPHQADAAVETRVCELRREHPWWGPRRIAHELARTAAEGSTPPGKSTVYRILVRHGLIEPGRRRRKRRDYRRWQRETPMALWQIDIVGGLMLADGTECKVVTGVDDHSRFCVIATVVVRATGRAVCLAFAEALRRYGVPEEVLTDNGKQFTDRFGKGGEVLFDRICRDNGITHRLTEPASPTTTGKVERFHKTFRREFLDHAKPFDTLLAAQAAVDTWVSSYNCDRPHQSLDMGYPADRFAPSQQNRAAEDLLPLRLPATLQPAGAPQAPAVPSSATPIPVESVESVEAVREDADTPPAPVVYQSGPVEFDRVVPASGNLAVRGKQFWLGPARAGVTVTFWADHDVIHLSIAGARVKTIRSHLSATDLAALAATGGRPAGPSPLPPAQPGAALEVDRTVSAGGLVSLGQHRLLAAEILAGRRVSVRIEDATLMFFDPDTRELLRTRANPLSYHQARILRGARPAGPPPRPSVEPVTIQRRVWDTGVIMVAGQKLALGRSHAHSVVTVHVAQHTITVDFPDGAQRTFSRTSTQPVRSWKAHRPRIPHTDDQPAAGT